MTVRIHIPANMRQFTEGQTVVDVSSIQVADALRELSARYPQMRDKLTSASDEVHSFVNLFVQGRSIRDLDGLNTRLNDGDTLLIVPALAGG